MSTVGVDRTEKKRTITRWNRRLGWALTISFPFSYFAAWLHEQYPSGSIGSWLSFLNVGSQVIGTLILLAHAGYSFFVFGFPAPRLNLRSLNGYSAYLVLLIYLLSQSVTDKEPQHTILVLTSFVLIGLHVLMAGWMAYKRPKRNDPDFKEDFRVLMSPDAEILDAIEARKEAGDIPQAKPALVGTNLDVSLGQVQVLFGVDLEINAGEIAVLMGNNGAGKTTTLRTLSGLQSADLGAVLIDGFDVTGLSPAGRAELGLSLVVGGRAVFGPLTVRENLELFGYRLPQSREEVDARIATVVAKFPWIGDRANQLASTLSGGEQQMLAVSQALIVKPKVLVIDEFSLGLAPKIVGQLIDLVREIAKQGTAVLLVEQSASVALDLADRIYLMERGRIVFNETGDVARANPERLTQMYLQGSQVSTS